MTIRNLLKAIIFVVLLFVASLPLPLAVWGWWYATTGVADRIAYMALMEWGAWVVPAQMLVLALILVVVKRWRKSTAKNAD